VVCPSLAETDVGQADGAPCEQSGKTGQGDEPVKDSHTGSDQVQVRETTPQKNEENRPQRTARAVNVGEHPGGVALLGQRSQGTGATVNTRHTDGDD